MGKVLQTATDGKSPVLAGHGILQTILPNLTSVLKASFPSLDKYIATLADVSVAFFYARKGACSLDPVLVKGIIAHLSSAYWAKENTLASILLAFIKDEPMGEDEVDFSLFTSRHAASITSFTPDLTFLMQLAIFLDLIGREWGIESLLYKAHSLMKAISPLIERPSSHLQATWNRSDQGPFKIREVLAELTLILYNTPSYADRVERTRGLQERLEGQSLPSLLHYIFALIQAQTGLEESFDVPSFDNASHLCEMLGVALYQGPVMEGALFSKGAGISLGFLCKASVEIAAMGPLVGELDKTDQFGLYRHVDIHPSYAFWYHSVRGQGTRLKPSLSSLYFALKEEEGGISLQTYLEGHESQGAQAPTYFTFFVTASALLVEGLHSIERQSVKGFCGPATILELIGEGQERMKWSFSEEVELHIAPLPCKDFFWQTSFLIAYRLENVKRSFKIEIT